MEQWETGGQFEKKWVYLPKIYWLTLYQSDSVWLLLPGAAFWSNCMRIRTGCSATMPSPCAQSTAFCKSSVTLLTAGHHIYSVRQTVWYHGHKLAQIVYEAIAEGGRKWVLRVRQSGESLRESVFTGVLASPPNRNSFHVSSSLPACPYTNVHGARLNHLLMSFPQLSLTITLRNNMVSDVMGFNVYST